MRVLTKLKCPLCGREAEVIAFERGSEYLFTNVYAECKCGTHFKAKAQSVDVNGEKITLIPFSVGKLKFPIDYYEWSRERANKEKNPSER